MNLPFKKLGPYQVTDVLGRGGMGTVYRGVDDEGNVAALKVLSPALAVDEGFRERFESEIKTLQTLNHPNIVQLLGFGEEAGQLFYVMELIDGISLQDELKNGRRFHWREVIGIALQICQALKHAHDHGVIHRDLKPANLLTDQNECIKLFDFGIAKLFGSTNVTTDTVLGTADYMAPEQAEGRIAGQKTDLYSLGSVLYALLAGKPPYTGKSVAEVVHKLRFDEPIPVGRFNPDTPLELEALIEKLLDKDPDNRVPTALALSHRLKAIVESSTVRPEEIADHNVQVFTQAVADHGHTLRAEKISDSPTVAVPEPSEEEDEPSELEAKPKKRTRFVTVEEAQEEKPKDVTATWISALRLVALISAVCALGFMMKLLLQPPSANSLYATILEIESETDPKRLQRAKPYMNRFISLHPDDPRRKEISRLLDEASDDESIEKLEAKARRRGIDSLSPIEQLFLQAIHQIKSHPEQAQAKLESLIQLFDADLGGLAESDRVNAASIVRNAKKRLVDLRQSNAMNRTVHRGFIERVLTSSMKIIESDPTRAEQSLQSIIQLYRDKEWAAALVEQARQTLQSIRSPAEPTVTSDPVSVDGKSAK